MCGIASGQQRDATQTEHWTRDVEVKSNSFMRRTVDGERKKTELKRRKEYDRRVKDKKEREERRGKMKEDSTMEKTRYVGTEREQGRKREENNGKKT